MDPKENETLEEYKKRVISLMVAEGMTEDEANLKCGEKYKKYTEQSNLKIETTDIKNMEVLEAGVWNGHKVTEKDIDEMITNFNNGILEPYANIDHDDKFTEKVKRTLKVVSLGFVSNLRREGKKLIANFKQVPRKFAELIDSGMLKKRSVEFFQKNFVANGKQYNNVLKAVSFFGADIPAVNSLSNDFDILLKSEEHAIKLQNENISTKIMCFKTGVHMDNIEISKKDYDSLLSFKTKSHEEVIALKGQVSNLEVQLADIQNENAKLLKEQEKYAEEKAVSLKKEAESFVSTLIEGGKLLPKFKDDKVADYIEKSIDDAKLQLFKEDLESRDKIIDLGELEGSADVQPMKLKADGSNADKINAAIEREMDKTGESFETIAPKYGVKV